MLKVRHGSQVTSLATTDCVQSRHKLTACADAVLSQLRDRMPPSASRVDDILRIVRNDVGEVTNLSL